MQGTQSAIVTGPSGKDEIHTDEFGRVRVQFHWDRYNNYDDKSSRWMRVTQDWAGAGWGTWLCPRIGHEVLVAHYDGDPDHPVVCGRVYNEFNKVPYELPKHKTRSTWKTDSTPTADGLNEIMFEDKKGEELFYLQAQKDLDKYVKSYETERTLKDRMQIVGHDRTAIVGHLDATMVGKRRMMQIMRTPVEGDLKIQEQEEPKVTFEKTTVDMTEERIIFTTGRASVALDGKNIRLEASGNITVHSKKGEITIDGKKTLINSGSPSKAPQPKAHDPLDRGEYKSHKADEVVAFEDKIEDPKVVAPAPVDPEFPPGIVGAFSQEVRDLIPLSPKLEQRLEELEKDGWTIKEGPADGGSYANREKKEIVVASGANALSTTQTIAHEAGHAGYTPPPYVDFGTLSKEDYVAANVHNSLLDEGEATLFQAEAWSEVYHASGGKQNMGVAGAGGNDYANIHNDFAKGNLTRDQARAAIAKDFGSTETTSTTGESYNTYYAKPYEEHWDKYHPTAGGGSGG